MNLQKIACGLLIVLTGFLLSCATKKTATVSVASFYNMGVAFIRTDANGKDYFDVQAKGANEDECRYNAKMELLKTLVYSGITQGTYIQAAIKTPQQEHQFKPQEAAFYKRCLDNEELMDDGGTIDNSNRLAQSALKTAVLTIKVQVGINRILFDRTLKQFTNEK